MTDDERSILTAILGDTQRLESVPERELPTGVVNVPGRRRYLPAQDLRSWRTLGVPIDLMRWLGLPPTPANRQRGSRALQRLETAELVERVSRYRSGRTTHVLLTAVGHREAERIRSEQQAEIETALKAWRL